MNSFCLKAAVCTHFRCTSRARATRRIGEETDRYLALVNELGPEKAAKPVEVPAMPGVDEDMRNWSVYMILEHNIIVNHHIRRAVKRLSEGGKPPRKGDPKKDVMPSTNPGEEQVEAFRDSVRAYLDMAEALTRLRGTGKCDHPVFGPFDAHMWHCMFGFHLMIHRKQAEVVAGILG